MDLSGLIYLEGVLTPELSQEIVSWLDQQTWSNKLKRRTQHYGYEYDYSSRSVSPKPTTPIHGPIKVVANWLARTGLITPTQCIVNEYLRDQGISAHTDSNQFGPVVVSISLLQPCNMIFSKGEEKLSKSRATPELLWPAQTSRVKHSVTLMPNSMVAMTGEARSVYRHEIPVRKTVTMPDGSTYHKPDGYRRISLTFRTLAQ